MDKHHSMICIWFLLATTVSFVTLDTSVNGVTLKTNNNTNDVQHQYSQKDFRSLGDEDRRHIAELTKAMKELGKKHQSQIKNFFGPTKSKVDQDFYTRNMASSDVGILDHEEDFIASSIRDESVSLKNPPRDFFFRNAVTMNHQRAERIKETRNTIFGILLRAAGQGVFQLNHNTAALIEALSIVKPVQTGVLFGDVYINDFEFLASSHVHDSKFYQILAEKVEETKMLRLQHVNYFCDWNKLVKLTLKNFIQGDIVPSADTLGLVNSINNAMDNRLDALKRELAMVKLDSMSLLAIQHAVKNGRQLFDVPLTERVSRRLLVSVYQLFTDTKDDVLIQRKIAERIYHHFRFDDLASDLNQYSRTWNEYVIKIASGHVPIAIHFSEIHLRISASLKETIESHLMVEREMRCGLINNVSISSNEQIIDVVANPNAKESYIASFLAFAEGQLSSVLHSFGDLYSSFLVHILPTMANFEKLTVAINSMMIDFDTSSTMYIEKMSVFAEQVTDSIFQQMDRLNIAIRAIFRQILEGADNLKLVITEKIDTFRKFRSDNITSRPGKWHIFVNAVFGRLQSSYFDNLPRVIRSLDDTKSAIRQKANDAIHHIKTFYDVVTSSGTTLYGDAIGRLNKTVDYLGRFGHWNMDQAFAIHDSTKNQLSTIFDNLVNGYGPFLEDLIQYCVVTRQIVTEAINTTLAIAQELCLNIPASIVITRYSDAALYQLALGPVDRGGVCGWPTGGRPPAHHDV